MTLAGNLNSIKLDGPLNVTKKLDTPDLRETYFDEREQLYLKASAPSSKVNLTATYAFDQWLALLRFVNFGAVTLGTWTGEFTPGGLVQNYNAKLTTDFAISYRVVEDLTLTVGGNNVFDIYPDRQDFLETDNGGWWESVQMGFNGAFHCVRLGINM